MLVLYPDTNVLLHARGLPELPWEELGHDEVELVLCGQVIGEIDKLKTREGRIGRLARDWNARIRALMGRSGMSDTVRSAGPRVTIRLEPGRANPQPARQGLDLLNGDQAILNQVLVALDRGTPAQFLTNDTIAAFKAKEFDVPAMLLADHWLRQPEADEATKELKKRDAEIARLRAAEPKLELHFVDNLGEPLGEIDTTLKRYVPVPEAVVDRLVEEIRQAAGMHKLKPTKLQDAAVQADWPLSLAGVDFGDVFAPVTQRDIDKYEAEYEAWLKGVRAKFLRFHDEWNARQNWPVGALICVNQGTRAAESALVEIEAQGSFQLTGVMDEIDAGGRRKAGNEWLKLPPPPAPPRIKSRHEFIGETAARMHLGIPVAVPFADTRPIKPRDEDRFYWKEGRKEPVDTLALTCQLWRHRHEPKAFGFLLSGSDEKDISGCIVGRAMASNLSDAAEVKLRVRVRFEDVPTTELAEQLVAEFRRSLLRRAPRLP